MSWLSLLSFTIYINVIACYCQFLLWFLDGEKQVIVDNTETNMVLLRRTLYLTFQSSLDFEECAHKVLKMQLKPGQEVCGYSFIITSLWSTIKISCKQCFVCYYNFYIARYVYSGYSSSIVVKLLQAYKLHLWIPRGEKNDSICPILEKSPGYFFLHFSPWGCQLLHVLLIIAIGHVCSCPFVCL